MKSKIKTIIDEELEVFECPHCKQFDLYQLYILNTVNDEKIDLDEYVCDNCCYHQVNTVYSPDEIEDLAILSNKSNENLRIYDMQHSRDINVIIL